ncbi:MAG: hypothetical protein FWC46_00735 [Actinomycetia bacterium]|nr:hypothetical protein [Actinomycetes bacterium]
MFGQPRLLVLFARSRGLSLLGPAVVVMGLLCYAAPLGLTTSPLDVTTASFLLTLTGLGAGVFAAMMFGTAMSDVEGVIPERRLVVLRAVWVVTIVVAFGVAGTLAMVIRSLGAWFVLLLWRNFAQGVAVACLSACLLPRVAAWIVPAMTLALVWLFGTKDLIGTPRVAAIPCYPPNSALAWVVTAVLVCLAVVIYAVTDARSHA